MHTAWPKTHSKNHVTRENQSTLLFKEPRERIDCCTLLFQAKNILILLNNCQLKQYKYFQKSMRDIA